MAQQVRQQGLDKFYTKPEVAKQCIEDVWKIREDWGLVVEPSAGNGSFYNRIPATSKIGLDISPEATDIIEQDFFTFIPVTNQDILVIGNPPFGKNSSLAIRFFNHASQWAEMIAFIVPRTFRKISLQNRLDLNFHLIHERELSTKPCCFEPPMMVKCCFQIWQRNAIPRRILVQPTTHPDWIFLPYGPKDGRGQPTPPQGAEFALRAYGGRCGEICETHLQDLRPKSWHWIKACIDKNLLINRFQQLDYSSGTHTARQNSIGRAELVSLYVSLLDSKRQ